MTELRIVFAGSPDAAVPTLRTLAAGRHRMVAVITRGDSPQGRKRVLTPTPVATAAEQLGLPVIKANRLGPVTEEIAALDADLGVIVAYGGLVREPLLTMLRHGWINLHFSLLPRWRGAAPVQHALIAGDERTGASVFRLVPELDAGDVFGTLERPIGRLETAGHLLGALADEGAGLVARTVDRIADGTAHALPQRGEVTLAPKLGLEDGHLDFGLSAETVSARLRGVTPEPGAFALVDGARLKVHEAAIARDAAPLPPGTIDAVASRVLIGTVDAPIELITVQPAGKRAMAAADWWRGRQGQTAVAE